MCDYSLEHVQSRPAVVGDKLVTTVFPNSITRGFAAESDLLTAVCLRPGTELKFEEPVKVDHALGFFPTKILEHTEARFREINPGQPHQHHDALEFPNGTMVLLTRLATGQKAVVLQLPVNEKPKADEPAEQPEKPAETAPAEQPVTETEPVA